MRVFDIIDGRIDLTRYLFHFTHRSESLSSFEALKSIVSDGYIKFEWAVRNGKRTVFGKKAAVCFTETPFYGIIDYVLKRNNYHKVDIYGIALLKYEMYQKHSARPVIYGTTNYKEEKRDDNGNYYIDDFPEDELYRYMLTAINATNDWTHEREWRWCDPQNISQIEGLPIWKINDYCELSDSDDYFDYDHIIIAVKSEKEANEILQLFGSKNDSKIHNKDNINNTYIFVVDDNLMKICKDCSGSFVRLDELKRVNMISVRDHLHGVKSVK